MNASQALWRGVYPAATTQFAENFSVDLDATQQVQTALVDDGVDGLVLLGTCGENNSLEPEEKRASVEAVGVSALIVLPAMVYGRGNERVRMPRMPLSGARRQQVIAWVEHCAEIRPSAHVPLAA